jgi:uncharacterized repeat protein (TIGR01451 family)
MTIFKRFLLLLPLALLLVPSSAPAAETTGPRWTVSSVSRPTNFAVAGKEDNYAVLVTNSGGTRSSGPVTITDELPAGLALAPGVSAKDELAESESGTFSSACEPTSGGGVACTYTAVVQPDDTLFLRIPVTVQASPPASCTVPAGAMGCVTNVVRVTGGGAPVAGVMETPTVIFAGEQQAREAAGFGIAPGGAGTGLSSVQAGAHPDLTTTFALDTENAAGATAGDLKNVTYDLPPGFAGDLIDTPACSAALFLLEECPVATQVGVTTVTLTTRYGEAPGPQLTAVYNLAPEPGEVAKIGFAVLSFHYEGNISVRAPGEPGQPYGLRTTFYDSTAATVNVSNVALTVWGVPASPVHDPLRWQYNTNNEVNGHFGVASTGSPAPYLSNPTSCTAEPLQAAFKVTSWERPNESEHPQPTLMSFGPIVGCDLTALWMEPKLTAEATSNSAGASTGLDVETNIRQTYPNPELLATSTLKREVVTLPEGMTLNPSAGAGLQACTAAQYGEELTHELTAQQKSEGHGCPNASKLADVRIKTPSITEEATGAVMLAKPYENPFSEAGHPGGSLLALYLIARANNRGVLVKTPGQVTLDPATGRITTTFDGLPPLPFSVATFAFNQGANAPLVAPPTCGNFTVTAELTPWADPEGTPLMPPIAPFPIEANCPAGNVPPFNPQVTSYPIHGNAGAYSPLYLEITRQDGEQEITGFASQFPAGLTGNLSGVEECSEAEIEAARRATGVEEEVNPSCPQGSEIGHSIAEAGVGSVLAQTPGKIYLGGPYDGSGACTAGAPGCAPFSIVAITSAHVGPFDLGTVVIHFPLDINPETAAVSIPSGAADQIPHIIKGIVIHVRNIRAYISRNDFMLNPTNCTPSTLSATVIGGGANPVNPAGYDPVTVNDPFQVAACGSLKFEPKFAASTSGKTSRAQGASLHVDLTYPAGSLGNDANIKQVKVDLPKQLPSRLTTLQKACTAAQFASNPAGCPAPSIIGHARALTPILPVALEGPAYFVSHGGEAFPELEIVLQGDGVTIVLTGNTFISKAGITSSTFKTVPDQPVTSFELTLPEGKFSALAANGSLCAVTKTVTVKKKVTVRVKGKKKTVTRNVKQTQAASLAMPTEFVGQNGVTIHQSTPVSVTGCGKTKPAAKKKTKSKKGNAKGKRGGKK